MKGKNNAGFSLIETLVAITVLAIIVVPTCSGMVMSFQMNAKAEQLMQAELAVSSAVEQLMASGINAKALSDADTEEIEISTIPAIAEGAAAPNYYKVTVKTNDGSVEVTTHIRATITEAGNGEEIGGGEGPQG